MQEEGEVIGVCRSIVTTRGVVGEKFSEIFFFLIYGRFCLIDVNILFLLPCLTNLIVMRQGRFKSPK